MRGESRYFLGNVDLGREQCQLLLQSIRVGVQARFFETCAELLDISFVDRRHARRNALNLSLDLSASVLQHRPKVGACSRSGCCRLEERLTLEREWLARQ